MFLAFGEAMPHKHNRDADVNGDSPMSGHYSCKDISGVWWMDDITERTSCWEDFTEFFHKRRLQKGPTG